MSGLQVGAGGLGVSLPRRSRGGRLLVSRQPDQGRGPGFQQRGQLHVTAAQVTPTQAMAQLPTCRCAKHSDLESDRELGSHGAVQFEDSAGTA